MNPLRLATLLAAAWLLAALPAQAASVEAGQAAFERLKCGACHRVTPPPAEETLRDRVAQRGPDLWFAGSKFQPRWLAAWLPAPKPLSGIRYDRLRPEPGPVAHPAAPAADVPDLVAYLTSLKDPQMRTGVISVQGPLNPMDAIQGRILFGKEQQCFACHKTQTRYGAEVGGSTAPSLVDAGARLNPDWIYSYLLHPRRYVPVPRMPIYTGAAAGYTDDQMAELARYIARMGRK